MLSGTAAVILFGLLFGANLLVSAEESSKNQVRGIEAKLLRDSSYLNSSEYNLFSQANIVDDGLGGQADLSESILIQGSAFLGSNNPSLNLMVGSGLLDRQRSGIVNYEVQTGDTPSYIAASFGISTDTLLWANNLSYWSLIKPGDKLVILPVSGTIHQVKKGEVLGDIVKKYKGDLAEVIAFNGLPADGSLQSGQKIVVPGGKAPVVYSQPLVASKTKAIVSAIYGSYGDKSHKFPWGQCTWYVAQKRYIPWSGHAKQWLSNAKGFGFQTGTEPQVGAVVATNETWYGHVAYVEAVADTYITVSEMSLGRGILHVRNIPINSRTIRGYIY